jgi:hypothetical protein
VQDRDDCSRRLTNDRHQRSLVEAAQRLRREWLRVNFGAPRLWGDVRPAVLLHVYGEDYRRFGGRERLHPPRDVDEVSRMDADLNLIDRPQPPQLLDVVERSSQLLTAGETEFLQERGWLSNSITDAEEQYLRENGLGLG